MARGGLKKRDSRRRKTRSSNPELVRSGTNLKDPTLLDSIKGGILDPNIAIQNTVLDISGSVPTKRNGHGDVIAMYGVESITSIIDAALTKTKYENETFEKVLDTSISELLPSGGGLSLKEFFAHYEALKESFPAYSAASSHEYLYSSSLEHLVEASGGPEAGIEPEELVEPTIIEQPFGPRVVAEEDMITISVQAAGSELTYQWRKDGSEVPNATEPSYVIPEAKEDDNGIYTCQISNEARALLSSDVKLEVVPFYSSGLVETNMIENGGGEKGVTGWTPTVGEISTRAWQQSPIKIFPDWETWDNIVAEQYPYLQVIDGGEIYLTGGSGNAITVSYQDIDLKPVAKGVSGEVEGTDGFKYIFYGWLGGHEEQGDFSRCKLEWFDAGNTILGAHEIIMTSGTRRHVVPGSSNSAVILTGFGNEYSMFHDFPSATNITAPLLDAISASWKAVPSGAKKAKVSMIMDRTEGDFNDAYVDNLSLVMIPMQVGEITAEEAEEVGVDPDDPDTYNQTAAPTVSGSYEGQYSADQEWRWQSNAWVPSYLYVGPGSSGQYENQCFTETALVFMADGKYKRISNIKEGDKILTFDERTTEYSQGTVTDFLIHEVNSLVPAVKLINREFDYDGLIGAPNHPIYHCGRWSEIQESMVKFEVTNTFIDKYYNLEVDGHDVMNGNHNYIVNGYIVSGLGDNPILNRFYQRQNIFKDLEKKRASII